MSKAVRPIKTPQCFGTNSSVMWQKETKLATVDANMDRLCAA